LLNEFKKINHNLVSRHLIIDCPPIQNLKNKTKQIKQKQNKNKTKTKPKKKQKQKRQ
jgi:hypothetical protein